jgi:hypothetical protein
LPIFFSKNFVFIFPRQSTTQGSTVDVRKECAVADMDDGIKLSLPEGSPNWDFSPDELIHNADVSLHQEGIMQQHATECDNSAASTVTDDVKENSKLMVTLEGSSVAKVPHVILAEEANNGSVEVVECRYGHNGPNNFKEETNASYAKSPYYLSGKMCKGCNALITNEGKGGRTEEEGQFFFKPTSRNPVWACRGVPVGSCDQILCSPCFQDKFMK